MLETKNLEKVYQTGDRALDDVSVTLDGTEVVAMIGPSGAGKSTFIRCINRLVEPTSGDVWLDDVELTALSKPELQRERRNIGMVFQEYGLVERLTVMENVLSGRLGYVGFWQSLRRKFPPDAIEHAYETLERVGLRGYENKRVDALSGGQRQRVGIARAVLQRPKLLLVDEPTSSLDPETSHAVMELLAEIAVDTDVPVVINIHEVHLAEEFADRILGLSDGSLVFDGPPAELDEAAKTRVYQGATDSVEASRSTGESADDQLSQDELLTKNG
ncbi:phosphonate ABC transporter ATP-binding protein [Natronorubrum sulfidifaciens]|uniref:Phosphonate ABC transporter ATPase n=1 Tax=Natronorubrum sulfidifaciens JCM 14089 TaxID=1230460 RepID=L9W6F7_9EURY|nr:phosphonate ABC transporter ATP-binding protein [Natronorubrum sulfidifaciens]ELY45055.1 phosphonate ABC transporter ATPase [Natronorubrum sulfidifaciens JCM 14089]